ncbi:MAG: hypothetical protein IH921_15090 [Gemmatimonadetes bacterium]|nr:hypothetical protein [Gemmatimonadota bacterium]
MSDVYIMGIDMIRFGRYPDRSVPELGAEAALLALDDAGLTIQDIEALYCGNLMQASGMIGQRILREIGQTGIPVTNSANACATGATANRIHTAPWRCFRCSWNNTARPISTAN